MRYLWMLLLAGCCTHANPANPHPYLTMKNVDGAFLVVTFKTGGVAVFDFKAIVDQEIY